MAEPVLYHWPANAAFGRTVPKAKFYEHSNIRTALREKFVDGVQRITWAYKLAEGTTLLHATAAVPEIQVFTIETKGGDVADDVLTAIDKSVHFPIIFEVTSGEGVRTVAAHKKLPSRAPTVGAYFTTDWLPADSPRRLLPTALDLPSLYEAILTALLPMETRAGETASEATERLNRSQKLQREIAALKKKLRAEPQLSRKIELRRQVIERASVLAKLTDPVPSNKE